MTVVSLPDHCTRHDLLDTVADAVGAVVRAVLDADRVAARAVIRDGARRHGLADRAEADLRAVLVAGGPAARPAARDLLVVQDAAEVSRLVDRMARGVMTAGSADTLGASRRVGLLLLARFGEERLHQLADGGCLGVDREFLRCGRCLFEAVERLEGRAAPLAGAHPAAVCGAELATAVLATSRHALRAA